MMMMIEDINEHPSTNDKFNPLLSSCNNSIMVKLQNQVVKKTQHMLCPTFTQHWVAR